MISNYYATVNLRLKQPVTCTLLILLFAIFIPVNAQENVGASSLPLSSAPYKAGERLTYIISYSNFPSVGHVEIQIAGRGNYFGRDAYQVKAHVQTTGVVSVALYSINNDYTTYIEAATGLPFRAEEVVRNEIRSSDSSQELNQTSEAPETRKQALSGTYDLLSVFYRIRALPLTDGASYSFHVRGQSSDYQAEVKVNGRMAVRTNAGSFDTTVAQVRVEGQAALKSFKVYFSDDERHVPVLLTAKIKSGELRAELAGSQFIKPAIAKSTPAQPVVPKATPAPTPTATAVVELSSDLPFATGEQLNYQVYLAGSNVAMGTATFQVRGVSRYFDRAGLLLAVKAETTGAAARVFVANDQIESYVDPKVLVPYRTVLNLVEGNRRRSQTLTINQDTGTATTDKGTRLDIPAGTHDYVSFFYAVRTFRLNPPQQNSISILVDNKPKTLTISSSKREMIEIGDQKVAAIPLKLTTDDPQSDKYQLRMWISDDKRRLPLRITAATQLGALRADLAILPTASH
ncbi:MAG TPA: DUF3108 domain-containing protein [Pyrinomonadaceae bacterium]|nr:DUF3108 domain-containing protein [Pyrinomonadaceae bacterium]